MPQSYEHDIANARLHAMWEEGGMQFRSNLLLRAGSQIELHAHHFEHPTLVPFGWFAGRDVAPDGTEVCFQIASKGYKPTRTDIEFKPIGYRYLNRAWHRHEFTLLEYQDQPGEVLCIIAPENMK